MTDKPPVRPQQPQGLNISLPDIYFIIFRHKWKILGILAVALLAAIFIPKIRPAPYQSEAKLYVRYILESKSPTQVENNDSTVRSPDVRGENLINTELEILTSLDLAQDVVDSIGPTKILGPDADRLKAAAAFRKSLTVEVQKNSPVIRLVFQHRDPEIVKPVLTQLIELYFKKHNEMHAVGALDGWLTQKADEFRTELVQAEEELKKAKASVGVISVPDAKKFQSEEISRLRQAILAAEAELAERKIVANQVAGALRSNALSTTNSTTNEIVTVSSDIIAEYSRVTTMLEGLRRKQDSDALIYTPESIVMKQTQQRIDDYLKNKRRLENENPGLKTASALTAKRAEGGPVQREDIAMELARVSALDARLATLNEQLEKLQKEAAALADAEGRITELQSRRDLAKAQYERFVESRDHSRTVEQLGTGMNITTIQKPSTPFRDSSKLNKARLGLLFGGFVAALGFAFLFEMFIDTSVKRPQEIESKIGLPLFLSVPLIVFSGGKGRLGFSRFKRLRQGNHPALPPPTVDSDSSDYQPSTTISQLPADPRPSTLDSRPDLALFFDALRDRLINFFEIKNLTHKPKLVAVTSCAEGSGVSTMASGLAASLSETGDGNVLLVDMNQPNGAARHFHRGQSQCGLDVALETRTRDMALVHDNLYMVSEFGGPISKGNGGSNSHGPETGASLTPTNLHDDQSASGNGNGHGHNNANANGAGDKLPRVLPKRFTSLMPKLKASDYDYIIFDMPPISQVSITPRIAKHMDMVLLVVEAEKTSIDVLKRATAFLSESKPNMAAVLNKRRTHVPKLLQQEL